MLRHIPLHIKLLAAFLVVGIGPFAFIGFEALETARTSLDSQIFSQLEAVRTIKQNQIEEYMSDRFGDIDVLAQNATVKNALSTFAEAFSSEGDRAGGDWWNMIDMDYGPWFAEYIRVYGYYDLFLIDGEGNIVYTVARESDLGMNLVTGPLKSSALGTCYAASLSKSGFADFEPYEPSNNEPAGFIAAPVRSGDVTIGAVALQISIDRINTIMQERTGLGATGETYLVGPDCLMRSDSYLDPIRHSVAASFANPAAGSVNTAAVHGALNGETGSEIIIDYNGNPVLSAYAPVSIGGVTWAIIAEIDEAEAFAPVEALQRRIAAVGAAGAIIIVLVALTIAWMVTHAFKKLFRGLRTFSSHELNETGSRFRHIIEGLTSSSEQVASASDQVAASSQQMAEGASEQAASLEEVSSSLEEMTSMTRQNADNASACNQAMREAGASFQRIGTNLTRLVASVDDISRNSQETQKIVKTIDEIAFQTNLLALNAAVEAARAGEAGLGFAVVADEVRNLSQRAAEAAKTTQELIEKTVGSVKNGAGLMREVQDAITENMEIGGRVGTLVAEITVASTEQAQGIGQITTAITQLDQTTQQAAANAEASASASEELTSQAADLNGMVNTLMSIVEGSSRRADAPQATTQARQNTRKASSATQTHRTTQTPVLPAHVSAVKLASRRRRDMIPLVEEFDEF